jgi:hypothetical protein
MHIVVYENTGILGHHMNEKAATSNFRENGLSYTKLMNCMIMQL